MSDCSTNAFKASTLKLVDGTRHVTNVKVGLVDSRGVFLTALGDGVTDYYKYSSESDYITQLVRDNEALKKRVRLLESELADTQEERDEWQRRSDKYRRDYNKLSEKVGKND